MTRNHPINSHELLESRMAHLFSLPNEVPEQYDRSTTVSALRKLPDDTADYLASVLASPDFDLEKDATPDKMLVYMLNHKASVIDIEDVFHLYSSDEMICEMAYGYFEWEEEDQFPTTNLREVICGLRRYVDIEVMKYSPELPIRLQDETAQSQVQALISMSDFLEVIHEYQYEPGVTMIHDEEIIELVVAYPERVEEIMHLIEELGEESVVQIKEIMGGTVHKSLSAGVI